MNKIKTIFANMSWLVVSQFIISILSFVWTLLTARYLGVSEYGILGSTMAFAGIFNVLNDLGTMFYAVREISTDFDSEQKFMDNCVTLRFFLGMIYALVVWIALIILGWNQYAILISMMFVIVNIITYFKYLLFISFQAHEQMKYQAITNILTNFFMFVFILIAMYIDSGLIGIMVAYIIGHFIGLIYCIYALNKNFVTPRFSIDLNFYKILILGGIPFALNNFISFVYYSIDMVMLTQISSSYATGLYNASYKLVDVMGLFYGIYSATIFPVMTKLFKDDEFMLRTTLTKSIKYLSFFTIPIAVAMLFYGKDIIVICFGNQYSEAGTVLSILVWTIYFLFVNGVCITLLNATHKERSVTIIFLITCLLNIILNLILIPRYDVYGAAFTTILSDMFLLFLALIMLRKIGQLPHKNIIFDLIKIIIASAILGIFLYVTKVDMWLAIPLSIGVYLLMIFILRFIDNEDKLILKQIMDK